MKSLSWKWGIRCDSKAVSENRKTRKLELLADDFNDFENMKTELETVKGILMRSQVASRLSYWGLDERPSG